MPSVTTNNTTNAHNDNTNEKRTSAATTIQSSESKALLPDLRFSYRKSRVAAYIAFLIFCNVVIPCILYYPLQSTTHITTKALIGISSAALGISSCFDGPFRLLRLLRYRKIYGPLGDDTWWHFDFVMWTYITAMLVFAFPLAIAPAVPLYDWFLMSTIMLVGPIGIIFFLSLLAFKLPFWCSSEAPGTVMKPAVFYVIEDVGAVDFKHGREFRRRVHDRYNFSPPFRSLMTLLTIYWTCATVVYCGVTAAVTWASPLNFAFGWVLGQLFLWAIVSAIGCAFLTRRALRKEREWWQGQGRTLVKEVNPKPEVHQSEFSDRSRVDSRA